MNISTPAIDLKNVWKNFKTVQDWIPMSKGYACYKKCMNCNST